jgi:hypothetical protein
VKTRINSKEDMFYMFIYLAVLEIELKVLGLEESSPNPGL